MKDVLLDTLIDSLKLIPFLFIAFFTIELLEHKLSKKSEKIIKKSGSFGPIVGSLLGIIPQCGFSVVATNLYITRIVSLGTLIAIYLSTSDEMLPILLSEKASAGNIIEILLIKFTVGMIAGTIIDVFIRRKEEHVHIHEMCEDGHCHCESHNIFTSSIIHTGKTIIFIAVITLVLNSLFHIVGEDNISKIFMKNSYLTPFISSLVGLIPNCGASVIITELYLKGAIDLASCIAGLLTGSGIALLVLFKSNKNIKENLSILATIYSIGVIVGLIIKMFI